MAFHVTKRSRLSFILKDEQVKMLRKSMKTNIWDVNMGRGKQSEEGRSLRGKFSLP